MSAPLGEVLSRRSLDGFTPQHPDRHPWAQPTLDHVELAYTGDVVTVPLVIADRVTLHGLDHPTWAQDWTEPGDWLPQSWGVAPKRYTPRR